MNVFITRCWSSEKFSYSSTRKKKSRASNWASLPISSNNASTGAPWSDKGRSVSVTNVIDERFEKCPPLPTKRRLKLVEA